MKDGIRILVVLMTFSLAELGWAARLHFGQTNYTVAAGGTFPAQVYLDMNEAAAGDQMPATGLFSMGVKVTLDPLKATVLGANDIVIPPEINTDGLGGPAVREVGSGYARAAGVIPLSAAQGYTNALLATVTVKNLLPGTYQLGLAFYRPSPWDNFIDFQGSKLDGQITNFVASTVQVQAQATGAPEIRTFALQTGNVMRLVFANTNFTPSFVGVQSTTSIYPTAAWTTDASVAIKTNSPGWYQSDLPLSSAPRRFYRIQARP